jgi:hypothetical protein
MTQTWKKHVLGTALMMQRVIVSEKQLQVHLCMMSEYCEHCNEQPRAPHGVCTQSLKRQKKAGDLC